MFGPELSMVLTCIINGVYNYPVHACAAGVECLVCEFDCLFVSLATTFRPVCEFRTLSRAHYTLNR